MALSRNESQEKAMIIIYDALTREHMGMEFDPKELIEDVIELPYDEVDLYIKEVVVKALLHKEEYIEKLEKHMETWTFKRLNRLNQAILLMSCAHFFDVKDADKAVIINVAVTLAKRYLDDNDYKFVNAILDNVLC